jgi:tetratricopeptide (TPR) repeat protein
LKELRVSLTTGPDRASVHYNLGVALKLKDQLDEAIEELKKALELDPKLSDAHYTLGVIYWQRGEFPAAAQQLRAAVEGKPEYAEAHYLLGSVLKQMEKLPEAAAALKEAIRLEPDMLGAHTNLAAVLQQMGDTAGAAEDRKVAEEIRKSNVNQQSAVFNTNSGIRLLNMEDIDGAISQFESAIKLSPDYAPAHYQLGLALKRKGKMAQGDAELKRAAELDPDYH